MAGRPPRALFMPLTLGAAGAIQIPPYRVASSLLGSGMPSTSPRGGQDSPGTNPGILRQDASSGQLMQPEPQPAPRKRCALFDSPTLILHCCTCASTTLALQHCQLSRVAQQQVTAVKLSSMKPDRCGVLQAAVCARPLEGQVQHRGRAPRSRGPHSAPQAQPVPQIPCPAHCQHGQSPGA